MPSKVKIYSYSKCATCRKALKWLNEKKITYILKDILNEPPSKEELRKAIDIYGETKPLFNTSGKRYRELGAETLKSMKKEEVISQLSSDGKLIKRPFLISNKDEILIGFKEYEWLKILA